MIIILVIAADVNVRHFRSPVYLCRVIFPGPKTFFFIRENMVFYCCKTAQVKLELKRVWAILPGTCYKTDRITWKIRLASRKTSLYAAT